jgi:hypothetical protein
MAAEDKTRRKWQKFFAEAATGVGGGVTAKFRSKETVIEYDNRSQLSQFFQWARSARRM